MAPSGARLELFTPFRLGLFVLGFAIFFLLLWLKNSVVAPAADIAVARALREATSAEATVVISGQYPLPGTEGRSNAERLVCGVVEEQAFAAVVRRKAGSKAARWRDSAATTYGVEALSLAGATDPSLRRPDLMEDCDQASR